MNRDRLARWVEGATPPALLPGVRRLAHPGRRRAAPEWEHVPEGWRRGAVDLRGWDDPGIADAYRTKLDAYRAALGGTAPLAYASSPALDVGSANVADQNTLLAFAHALLVASWGKSHVSVLDWGGGLGYHAFVARAALPETVELEYHCRDLARICELGRDVVPEVTFWDDDECFERRYDLVLASSALQYVEDWRTTLGRLAAAASDALFLTRVPIVVEHPSFVVLQRAHGYRFESEYLSWVFNRDELLGAARDAGVDVVREFVLGFRPHVVGAPEQDETWAYLFRR
ncbi:MAG TPA: methyltransferase, TIGR04325 family [Acidimicrobiia bacterium]|nr:methyltransferase, TIGR04325 family [Acidimicrobiia bacterium]